MKMAHLSSAVSASLLLHIALGVLLVVSMNFHQPLPEQQELGLVQPIEAVVIDEAALNAQLQKLESDKRAARQKEEERIKALEQRAAEARRQREAEEQRVQRVEQERRKKLEEKRQADQAAAQARKQQEQEQKRAQQLEAERLRKEQERKREEEIARKAREKREAEEKALKEAQRKREEAEKQRQEAERKQRQAAERAEQERFMQEQLEAEQAARSQRRRKQVLTEVQKYTALITNTIRQNWIVDESMKGTSCRLNIRLAPNGLVLQVKVLEGNPNICRASERAVLKAVTLPVPKEADVFQEFRNFNLTMSQ